MVDELSFWGAILEEVVAEPDLSEVGLVFVCGVDLFDCEECFAFEVESFPHFWKASSSQLLPSQVALNERFILDVEFVMGSFETCIFDIFIVLIRNDIGFLFHISFVPHFGFGVPGGLSFLGKSVDWLIDLFLRLMLLLSTSIVSSKKLAPPLYVEFVPTHVGVGGGLTAFGSLFFVLWNLQVFESLNVDVEVHGPFLLLAAVNLAFGKASAIVVHHFVDGGPFDDDGLLPVWILA